MLLPRDLGLPPGNEQRLWACALLLDRGFYRDEGIGFGWGRSETCVTGMVLSILTYFGMDDDRLDEIARHLLERQMADGGWNCRRPSAHGSVHTTISVPEGPANYQQFRGRMLRKLTDNLVSVTASGESALLYNCVCCRGTVNIDTKTSTLIALRDGSCPRLFAGGLQLARAVSRPPVNILSALTIY